MASYRQLGQPEVSYDNAVNLVKETRQPLSSPRLDLADRDVIRGRAWDFVPGVKYQYDGVSALWSRT